MPGDGDASSLSQVVQDVLITGALLTGVRKPRGFSDLTTAVESLIVESVTRLERIAMTEENEWGELEAQFVTTLRDEKTEPVPPEIVKLAQRSLNGIPNPDNASKLMHAMQYVAPTEAKAAAFARHMRNAGLHTTPKSSIVVVIDPQRRKVAQLDANGAEVKTEDGKVVMVQGPPVNPKQVAFRAGVRRGKHGSA